MDGKINDGNSFHISGNGHGDIAVAFPSLPRRNSFGDLKIRDRYRRRGRGRENETRGGRMGEERPNKLGLRLADLAPMVVSGSSLPITLYRQKLTRGG
jgi:hypothetical protein